MKKKPVKTAVPLPIDRYTPPRHAAAMAIQLADSGVVDYQQPWDQLLSWWPSHLLWNMHNTPLAKVLKDHDSFSDVYALSAYYAAVTNHRLGASISFDSIRHGPAEMVQTMQTLLNLTDGNSIFMVGGGEQKQCKPFGWNRSEGLGRLEDLIMINNLMWECDGPVDFQGNHWKFEKAWVGGARQHKPKLLAMGGGPRLIELATKHADGFATCTPLVWDTPELCAERITEMKQQVAAHGRDPEEFEFCIFAMVMPHEDPAMIERTLDNPLFRNLCAIMGRINMNDWDRVGIEPPMPRDWSYATRLVPTQLTREEVDYMASRTTHEMSARTWICGTPQAVAKELGRYIDAGVTQINLVENLTWTLPFEEQHTGLERLIEVCRLLKQH